MLDTALRLARNESILLTCTCTWLLLLPGELLRAASSAISLSLRRAFCSALSKARSGDAPTPLSLPPPPPLLAAGLALPPPLLAGCASLAQPTTSRCCRLLAPAAPARRAPRQQRPPEGRIRHVGRGDVVAQQQQLPLRLAVELDLEVASRRLRLVVPPLLLARAALPARRHAAPRIRRGRRDRSRAASPPGERFGEFAAR